MPRNPKLRWIKNEEIVHSQGWSECSKASCYEDRCFSDRSLPVSPAHSLCMASEALLLEACPIKTCPRGWGAGGAPSLPLSKTWAVTVLLFMSPPCPMSGLEGTQPGPAVWPHLSHVIRCLVAADLSAIWLSGLGVRGDRQQLLTQPLVSWCSGNGRVSELLC